MNQSTTKGITRTGLLLAATLILQGLRLFIPIPPQVSMFLIGSLVNACLVLAVLCAGRKSGLVVACITPIFAWLEGMLPFFPFIFPVAVGNCAFVMAVSMMRPIPVLGLTAGAALCKAAVVYGAFYGLFSFVEFPDAVRHMILLVMSWPQIVTAAAGCLLAYAIAKRLSFIETR